LKNCGIIEAYTSSKWLFYRLNPEFAEILKTISRVQDKKSE